VRAGRISRIAAAALVVGVAVAAGAAGWRAFNAQAQALAAQQKAIAQLQSQVASLRARGANQVDWTAIAAEVAAKASIPAAMSVAITVCSDVAAACCFADADSRAADAFAS